MSTFKTAIIVYINERIPTTSSYISPYRPDVAVTTTLLCNFIEESTANVFAVFVAINVLLTKLHIGRRHGFQTIEYIGKEISAYLQTSSEKLFETRTYCFVCSYKLKADVYLYFMFKIHSLDSE